MDTDDNELRSNPWFPKSPPLSSSLVSLPPGKKGMDAGFKAALFAMVFEVVDHSIVTIRGLGWEATPGRKTAP
jgi:hypothetical protein